MFNLFLPPGSFSIEMQTFSNYANFKQTKNPLSHTYKPDILFIFQGLCALALSHSSSPPLCPLFDYCTKILSARVTNELSHRQIQRALLCLPLASASQCSDSPFLQVLHLMQSTSHQMLTMLMSGN